VPAQPEGKNRRRERLQPRPGPTSLCRVASAHCLHSLLALLRECTPPTVYREHRL